MHSTTHTYPILTHSCTPTYFIHTQHIDDDIFYTPAKTPPKKKKQWMDDLLDDDKDLFGDIKSDTKDSSKAVAPSKEREEAKKPKSGGGLFDDYPLDDEEPFQSQGQDSNVNGHNG